MRVMVAPMKVGVHTDQSIRFIKSKRPRLFNLTEMDLGDRTYLGAIGRVYGNSVDVYTRDLGEHSQEIPIVHHHGNPLIRIDRPGFRLIKLSDDVPGGGVGNDRWLARLPYSRGRGRLAKNYVYYATHLNAVVQHLMPGKDMSIIHGPRWDAYKHEIDRIEKAIRTDLDDPTIHGVSLAGDLNMIPEGEGRSDHHSPHQMLHRLGMGRHYVNTRVVYLAVSEKMTIRNVTIHPAGAHGWPSDHAAISATI